MEDMTKDYNALLEIKIGLDREIAMYQKILEGEEARLGLSPCKLLLCRTGTRSCHRFPSLQLEPRPRLRPVAA